MKIAAAADSNDCGHAPREHGRPFCAARACGPAGEAKMVLMRPLTRLSALALAVLTFQGCVTAPTAPGPGKEVERWRLEAQNTTIVRDDWGIAHIHGKSD